MDSHLLTPEIDSVNFHIYHSYKGDSTAAPFVVLDLDDIDGFGPETISIKKIEMVSTHITSISIQAMGF